MRANGKRVSVVFVLLCMFLLLQFSVAFASGEKEEEKVHIKVVTIPCPNVDLTKEMLPQFEERSGITVTWEETAFADIHSKIMNDFVAHTANYDVVAMDETWLPEFVGGGYIDPIEEYVEKSGIYFKKDFDNKWPPAEKYPTIYVGDALTPIVNLDAVWEGELYGIPGMSSGIIMLFYRKSLFEDSSNKAAFRKKYGYNLKAPKTWNELRDIAEFFTKTDEGYYGLSMSLGKGNPAICDYASITWSFGGGFFAFGQGLPDPDDPIRNMPIGASEANIKALEYVISLKPFMPPGVAGYEWAEPIQDFMEDKAAMAINWSDFSPDMEGPQSKVVGDVGYAHLPGNPDAVRNNVPGITPGDSYTIIGSWVYMINKDSKNKEAAWEFIAWATGLTMTDDQLKKTFDSGFINMNKKGFSYTDTLGYKTGRYAIEVEAYENQLRKRPYITGGLEWEEILGTAVQEAFLGNMTAEEALKDADLKVHKIMQRDGYIPQDQPYVWPSKYVNKDGSWVR